MNVIRRGQHSLQTDATWNRAIDLGSRGLRAAPRATAEYILEKVPIVGWLPRYNYRWLTNDVIAGLTLGIMLIPQSLAYADIATIPVQYGLMSSWLPATLYAFMGTSKDLSTGPTSLIGLLTSDVVKDLTKEGYTPQQVATAVAMGMGIYGMILGFLKLGFLLDFVSTPILNGFISAAAITIGLGQVDNLLGEENVRDPTGDKIHDIFAQLPNANGPACGIGFGSIVILVALEQAGKRWGNKNRFIFYLSICRAFICLLLFTGISYAVNKPRGPNPDNFLFDVAEVIPTKITPEVTDTKLFSKAFPRAIAPFVAAALEHVAIARAFGIRNNYVTDTSQELCYLGLTNLVNSFFHAMGVGGAMSRTAVNSGCKVKSPLSGLITTAVVLVCIYELSGTLYWIPSATLAAIVITAIWPLIGTPRTYYNYWRTSLTDFIASMLAFWCVPSNISYFMLERLGTPKRYQVTLFVSSEIGIGTAVAWMLVQYLIRQAFSRITQISSSSSVELPKAFNKFGDVPNIPLDTQIFRFNDNFFYPNAHRMKTQIMDEIQTHHCAEYNSMHGEEADRSWSVVGEKRVKKLRRDAGVRDAQNLPPIGVVVLDFTKVNHLDATASLKLREFFNDLKQYAGVHTEVRFVGLAQHVKDRFVRAKPGWQLLEPDAVLVDGNVANSRNEIPVRVFASLSDAIAVENHHDVGRIMEEKSRSEHAEKV